MEPAVRIQFQYFIEKILKLKTNEKCGIDAQIVQVTFYSDYVLTRCSIELRSPTIFLLRACDRWSHV